MKRALAVTVLALVVAGLGAQEAAAQATVNLTGTWTLTFKNGKTGTMVLDKTKGTGGQKSPCYTGKLTLPGFGEWRLYCIQIPTYHVVGKWAHISIGSTGATKWISCQVTGKSTMPGKIGGTGWGRNFFVSGYHVPFTATR
jgi:hypothetical protein